MSRRHCFYSTAEAGRPTVTKHRFRKRYHHPELDAALTATRLKQDLVVALAAMKLEGDSPAHAHLLATSVPGLDVVLGIFDAAALAVMRLDSILLLHVYPLAALAPDRQHP